MARRKNKKQKKQKTGAAPKKSDGEQKEIPFESEAGDIPPADTAGEAPSETTGRQPSDEKAKPDSPRTGASAAAAAAAYARQAHPEAKQDASAETEPPVCGEDASASAEGDVLVPASALREAEAQRDEYLEIAKRAQADLANYRKRIEKERADLKRDSLGFFLREILTAFHDLDRVIGEGEKGEDREAFLQGLRLSRDNLWKTLEKVGVVEIPALGQPFDPNVHEALTTMPSGDHEPNTVIEVFQPGYKLEDFVLAPARVIVSAASA